eukprot:411076_1
MDLASKVVFKGAYPFNKGNNVYVSAALYLNGNITKKELTEKISFFYDIPRFKYIPHWNNIDGIAEFCSANSENFKIEKHIHETTTKPAKLQHIMDEIRNKTLNRNIPYWDVWLIHIKESTHQIKTVIIIRWDHCLGDGITFLTHIASKLFEKENGEPVDFGKNLKRERKQFVNYFDLIKTTIDSLYRSILLLLSPTDTQLPILNEMGCVHGKQKFYHKKISLKNIRQIYYLLNNDQKIRKHYGICDKHHFSMNDIFLSLSSGSIRNSLIYKYYANDQLSGNETAELIEKLNNGAFKSLVISAPPSASAQKTFNNNYIPLSVPFNINIENDIDRIIQTSKSILPQKSGWNLMLTALVFDVVGMLWIDFIKIMNYRSVHAFSNHHSSLKGPSFPIYFNGYKVNDVSVHVGDTVKTHVIEILYFDDIASINMSVNEKYFKFAQLWGEKYEILIQNILNTLTEIKK